MLEVKNLLMRFNAQLLFEDVNLKLTRGNRYGLIGANGAGKSTFLKILSGEIEANSGEIVIENGLKVGVLGQDQFAFENFSVKDAVLYGNKRLYDAVKEKEQLYMSEEFTDAINDRLAQLEMISAEEDPRYEYEVRIEKILSSLGFRDFEKPMSEVENSDKFKVLLAQVLFPKPDILFLDEPTNNLDIDSIKWLENELNRHEGTMVLISHDRHFLNAVCTHILDVDFKKIRQFAGNYDDWYIASTLVAKQHEMERDKKLKKLDIEEIKVSSRRDPSILFRTKRDIGNEILEVRGISKKYDKVLFENFSFKLEKNDKVAIIGANGVGKSTLAKIIIGEVAPDSGDVHVGATIEPSYFAQDTTNKITGELKLYEWLQDENNKDLDEIRKCLGRMLFSGAEQEKSVGSLSGGEKHRLMLSRLMLERGNLLVLDEPNNHLDLEAIIALGEALYKFGGNVICVSHDRELIDAFANRIIHLKGNGEIVDFKGTFEEYAAMNEGATA